MSTESTTEHPPGAELQPALVAIIQGLDQWHRERVQARQGAVPVRLGEGPPHIGHYHTAGVPDRREIDDDQEINYPGIMKAIAATGYKGFVGQEFIPTWKDPKKALSHAVKVCDV